MRFFLTAYWILLALSYTALAAPGGPFVGQLTKLFPEKAAAQGR